MIREVQKSPLLGILQSGRNFPDFFRVKIGGGGGYYRWNRMFILYVYLVHMPETGGLKP